MYIEICRDVLEDAIAKSGQKVNNSLDLLQLFAFCALQGKHIVVVPSLRNDKTLYKELGKIMLLTNVDKLRRNDRISYLLPSIKNKLRVYCLVTYNDNKQVDKRAIVINPSRLIKFEPYLETRFITENLMDAKFFSYIANYFIRQNLLKGVRVRYDAKPGGGSSTCDIVRDEIQNQKRFSLVVVDSDKKYPWQSQLGETAQKIVDVMSAYPCQTCGLYIMERVMEVENLIPKKIIKKYASDKSSDSILEKDFSFYDMKFGITLKGLFKDEVFNYWKPLMQAEGIDYSKRVEAKVNSCNRAGYERYIDENSINNVLKKGFGSDLLRIVTCFPERDYKARCPELESEMSNNIKSTDLTHIQILEWDNIGEYVFSWTCGLTAISA